MPNIRVPEKIVNIDVDRLCRYIYLVLMRPLDLRGKKFGRLTVIRCVGNALYKGKKHSRLWECLCICGKRKNIPACQLNKGRTKSCGCSLLEYRSLNARKPYGQNAAHTLFLSYKCGARKRNIPFEMEEEVLLSLSKNNCFYCGSEPSTVKGKRLKSGTFVHNGLDRVDNSKGYSVENCVACCETCNRAKLQQSQTEFLQWISKAYLNLRSKCLL